MPKFTITHTIKLKFETNAETDEKAMAEYRKALQDFVLPQGVSFDGFKPTVIVTEE